MKSSAHTAGAVALVAVTLLAAVASACELPSTVGHPEASATPTDTEPPRPPSSPTPGATGSPWPTEIPSSATPLLSGIFGEISIGPACPVLREDSPCPDRPYQAEVVVENAATREPVVTVRADAEGRFQVSLPPGDYYLSPVDPDPGRPPSGRGANVTVVAGTLVHVSVKYDSGIR